ncbi:MAG TPA: class I SAM-dependent methyltransferase [Pseudonocardiaceae bacterium]
MVVQSPMSDDTGESSHRPGTPASVPEHTTSREKVTFTGVQQTMLATLYYRALESRSPNPILGDREAERAVARIDHDFGRITMRGKGAALVALRGKSMDRWVEDFLDRHPECVVLYLGCGLDTRVYRIDPPSTVQWYDNDLPDVIELRRRLFPERANLHTVGMSVTDPHLLDTIPNDRPVLAVAEGLTMYLSPVDGIDLLRRITEHFPGGEIVFDACNRFGIWLMQQFPLVSATGAHVEWAIDDPRALEHAVPGLTLTTEWPFTDAPEVARFPWLAQQLLRAWGRAPVLRRTIRLLRYRFGQRSG